MEKTPRVSLLAKGMGVLLSGACRLLTGVRTRWIGCQPAMTSRIYYANHSSHLDGLVIWSGLPPLMRHFVHPVAAKDYWDKTPFRRYLVNKVFRAVLIERKGDKPATGNVLAPLEAVLESKHSLILFPEGTRGDGEALSEFKSGLYHLVKKYPQVEVVPIYLENLNRVLPKGSKVVVPIICSATVGKPLSPLGEDESKSDFLQRAKAALEELMP
ncbi:MULTISPECIES: lysophospholipid acyltransferase family protein [Providencia]|uniref:1-acyl-sn-glycerol-3-phosphate acyltransferase n=1 Tax=Providencia heimbachae ATCC 35613 TaxID=1354272 RepID=A0A1B7JUU7_9GAMM|nr:lysophospholipid acyltransferase family protein [Providencia heimbachae]MBP6122902.1 1-acyl-sn-glycerol-3-phosphate acyltransferase [Providencia sp.]MDD9338985.1 lysophospholipid acyltransferase family protein [Providencia heimbachae]NIH24446.1 1-acyl-sn-glycerol-3-phosphate acyltransferase [Providencia heimbachae]OAT51679.1 1-acyl-sn-glycerol-3-phosphate acyltransferase [Providencia heimbachae ATCC 35613]QCJ71824.1 1-acyl-sn-glycerol-3-phosphate acyltransferase [Providencia heimbachae]